MLSFELDSLNLIMIIFFEVFLFILEFLRTKYTFDVLHFQNVMLFWKSKYIFTFKIIFAGENLIYTLKAFLNILFCLYFCYKR
jgi:hypothetical protein